MDGKLYPPFLSSKAIHWLRNNYNASGNDVFVVSYPKTGTMWTLNLVTQINKKVYGNDVKYFNSIRDGRWIEQMASNDGIQYFKDYINKTKNEPHRIWQTHAFQSLFPCKTLHKNTKLIYVTRNPKDTLVSQYFFVQKEPNIKYKGNLNHFFNWFTSGITINGSYYNHLLEWYNFKKTHSNQIMFLYYEDMVYHFKDCIRKVAKFLNVDTKLTETDINDIEKLCSFNFMKNESKSKKIHLSPEFFRKGKVGDWKNYLNESQSKYLDELTFARLYNTDIKYFKQLSSKL